MERNLQTHTNTHIVDAAPQRKQVARDQHIYPNSIGSGHNVRKRCRDHIREAAREAIVTEVQMRQSSERRDSSKHGSSQRVIADIEQRELGQFADQS